MSDANTSEGDGAIGLLDAVALEVGLIVGGALFALVGVGVALSGPGVVVSFAIAIAIAALGLVPTAMLGASFPTTCGHYRYPARFVSPRLAFVAAWGLGISMFTGGLPLYARTGGEYLAELVPVSPAAIGLAILTVFFALNLLGIRLAARAQLVTFVGLLAALGAFVGFGLPAVDTANLTPVFSSGAVGVVAGAGVLYFTCLGANFVIDLGGEIRDATVTIPRSFLLSIPIVFALYALVGVVSVGTIGAEAMADQTLAVPAERFLSAEFQALLVVGGALFAVATTLNATYILIPRYARVLADEGLFPAGLGATNDRFGTAHWALLGTYLLGATVLFAPLPFEDLGTMLAFGGAFVVLVVMLAAIRVIRDPPASADLEAFPVPTRAVYWMAVAAVPLNAALILLLATQSPALFVVWVGLVALGLVYHALRTNYYRSANTPSTG